MTAWPRLLRHGPLLLVVLVAGIALAQTATTGRVFPYVGYLEEDGFPVDGTRYVRINLYPQASGGSVCKMQDAANTLVAAGRFQVDVIDVPDPCLVGGEVFAAVAVGADAGSLVNLASAAPGGRVRIGAVPFAAASAKGAPLLVEDDLTVLGNTRTPTLDVTSNTTQALDVTGNARIGSLDVVGTATTNLLRVLANQDAGPNALGSVVVGDPAAGNVALDGNEIMARNNSSPSELFINNNGGNVTVGDAASQVTVRGNLTTNGRIKGKMFGAYGVVSLSTVYNRTTDGFLVGTARRNTAGSHCYIDVTIGANTFTVSNRVEAGVADVFVNFPIPAGTNFSVVNTGFCQETGFYFVPFGA